MDDFDTAEVGKIPLKKKSAKKLILKRRLQMKMKNWLLMNLLPLMNLSKEEGTTETNGSTGG